MFHINHVAIEVEPYDAVRCLFDHWKRNLNYRCNANFENSTINNPGKEAYHGIGTQIFHDSLNKLTQVQLRDLYLRCLAT